MTRTLTIKDLSPSATTLLLMRHAETSDNAQSRLSGWTDTDLTARGELQITLLAEHINRVHQKIDALYASPLIRARRTAEAIGALTGHIPILLDDLREMHFGHLDGLSIEQIKSDHDHVLRADEDATIEDFAWPGGESRLLFTRRVLDSVGFLCREHPGGQVAVVTHGGVIATFLALQHGETAADWRKWVVPNASLTEIVWDGPFNRGVLVRHGDAEHLAELTATETAA